MILFGLPGRKDAEGSCAWDRTAPCSAAARHPRRRTRAAVITDVCLCQYTDHGHCGVLGADGTVDNDATLPLLARVAVSHAQAGADVIAPSDMMDGRVAAIRSALDGEGFAETADHELRGEVRLRLLRPVPRRRRLGAAERRPPRLPDGSGQRPRGAARGARSTRRRAPTC